MKVKIKKGLQKISRKLQRFGSPSSYTPFYPLPTGKANMEYQQELFTHTQEDWETFKSKK